MTRPIPDKAEVALEYPDKFYVGTFDRTSRFDAHLDATGVALILERPGEENVRKSIHMHLNYDLFAQILEDIAATVAAMAPDDMTHRAALAQSAQALVRALAVKPARRGNARRAQPEGRVRMKFRLTRTMAGAFALLLPTVSAFADPDDGEKLARRWCAACHVVAPDQQRGSTEAPPFAAIARMPGFSRDKLAFFLLEPHPKMPSMGLSRQEAADLADYISKLGK